jgi:hypothetical protein
MPISPVKPDFFDGTWRGKIRVWATPTLASGANTDCIIPGLKRVFAVSLGGRPGTTFTQTTTGAANSTVVLTITVTGSTTGSTATPLVVYGQ